MIIDTGLLVIRGANNGIMKKKLPRVLERAIARVRQKLYVHLEDPDIIRNSENENTVAFIYHTAWSINPEIDLRVLLNRTRVVSVDRVFTDRVTDPDSPTFPVLLEGAGPELYDPTGSQTLVERTASQFENVVIGGTFDRLHTGHKVLISTALLLANKSLLCGVTDGPMIKTKTLWELIEPIEERCKAVCEFVNDISDGIECETVPIYDPFGPAITRVELDCIVSSQETRKGADAVNIERKKRELKPLEIKEIDLLEAQDSVLNETKISSSSARRQLLGSQLREPELNSKTILSSKHYMIGLTGGIASGKTHISKYMETLGCEVIDCDKIGHSIYEADKNLRLKMAEVFGSSIINEHEQIDRSKLGSIVFSDENKLKQLNELVWPAILQKVKSIVEKSQREIVIIDAALLLESSWHKYVHQVWSVFVDRAEATKRICARDSLNIDQAESRLNAQMSNAERIAQSNVVFSSLWEFSETESQVKKAFDHLKRTYIESYRL